MVRAPASASPRRSQGGDFIGEAGGLRGEPVRAESSPACVSPSGYGLRRPPACSSSWIFTAVKSPLVASNPDSAVPRNDLIPGGGWLACQLALQLGNAQLERIKVRLKGLESG